MSANSVFLLVLVMSIVCSLALAAASVKWGLKWAKVTEVSLLKALGLHFIFTLTGVLAIVAVIAVLFAARIRPAEQSLNILAFMVVLLTPCVVVAMIYKVRLWRAAIGVIPYLIISFVTGILASVVARTYVYEAFLIPTNAMAPTLLGEHLEAPCPRCGSPAYGSPPDPRSPILPEGVQMICSSELQSVFVKDAPQDSHGGDRLLVCKLLKPKRWDLIVFRYPQDPTVNYAKRLVGLPGEKLAIHDGAVWINGAKMEPPQSIKHIRYSPTIDMRGQVYSGPGSVPVELGADEYFVLGDFVDASSDSRFWEQGAPGHPPYAIPKSYIVGVVINIYWPPSRWTSFR